MSVYVEQTPARKSRKDISSLPTTAKQAYACVFADFCIVEAQHLSTARQRKIQPFYFVNSIAASAKRLPRVSILR